MLTCRMPLSTPSLRAVLRASCFAAVLMLCSTGTARADTPSAPFRAFGSIGGSLCTVATGCQTPGSGTRAGTTSPVSVAVAGGEVFAANGYAQRIDVFSTAGTFLRAFGAGVNPTGVGSPNICTTTCQNGTYSTSSGALANPNGVAVSGGEVFVASQGSARVDVFTTAGVFVRAFGNDVDGSGDGTPDVCTNDCSSGTRGTGAGEIAGLNHIAVTATEVFVPESDNRRVSVFLKDGTFVRAFGKSVNASGVGPPDVCTTDCQAGTSGSGAAGELYFPSGVAVDAGTVYVTELEGRRVSAFSEDGTFQLAFGSQVDAGFGDPTPDVCTTFCKNGNRYGGGSAFGYARDVAAGGGHVYVADADDARVEVFAADGTYEQAFGSGVDQNSDATPDVCTDACGAGSRSGAAGALNYPSGVAVSGGELFVGEVDNRRISVLSTDGTFERAFGRGVTSATFTCTSACVAGDPGGAEGQFDHPSGVALTADEVFVADEYNSRISVSDRDGTFVRSIGSYGMGDGHLQYPQGLAIDGGEVFVADFSNQRIAVFDTDGTFLRNLGAGVAGGGAGQLNGPVAVAVAGDEVFVAEQGNYRVSVFAKDGTFLRAFGPGVNGAAGDPDVCTTVCQSGAYGSPFQQIAGIAVAAGEVFVSDAGRSQIYVYSAAGAFVRNIGTPGGGEGELRGPMQLTIADSKLYVPERDNHRVSVFTTAGTFLEARGTAGGASGQFDEPGGVAVDGAELFVGDTANNRIDVVDLRLYRLGADPASLDFGAQDVSDSETLPVTVTNTGTEPVTLDTFTIGGADAGDFTRVANVDDCEAGVLAAGADCTVEMEFDASATGARSATLTVTSDEAPDLVAALAGSGTATTLSADPTTLAFGDQDVDDGATGVLQAVVTNAGTEPIAIDSVSDPATGPFTRVIERTAGRTECAVGVQLAAGDSCDVHAQFDPAAFGPATGASIVVGSNAPDVTIGLTGRGTQTSLQSDDDDLDFGGRERSAGPTSIQTSTLTNTGTEDVTLTNVALAGVDPGQFERVAAQLTDCAVGTVLSQDETCDVRVRFDPSQRGAQSAVVGVESNVSPVEIALTGEGVDTLLGVDPAQRAFGSRVLGSGASAPATSTVTNTGTETVTLSAVAVGGSDFARVGGDAADCAVGTVLDRNESCDVRVSFTPTATGDRTATATVSSNAPGVTVALSGTGTRAPAPVVTTPTPTPTPAQTSIPTPTTPTTLRHRQGPETTTLTSGRRRIASGYFVICPAGGPACTVTATLKHHRTGVTAVSLGTVRMTVPAGTSREVRFTLTARGQRLLRRYGQLDVTLRGVVRFGDRQQVRVVKLTVKLPS